MSNMIATVATSNYGLYNLGNTNQQTILVERSHLIGSLNTIRSHSAYSIKVSSSKLKGGDTVANGGLFNCLDSYDEAYKALNSSCGIPTGEPIGYK